MANYFPAQAKINPHFDEPDLIITQAQASGAFHALPNAKPNVKLGEGDLMVYVNNLDLRQRTVAAQSLANKYPTATLKATYISTATYNVGIRAVYNRADMQAASNYAVGLPNAQKLACHQGIFQQMRNALLYGYNPSNNEGLLNTAGATTVSLPPDQYGNTTFTTYDSGDMGLFFLNQIVSLRQGMYQSGGIASKVVVVGPQRIFLQLATAAVVQITSYQRPGAGAATTGTMIKDIVGADGSTFDWVFDDTLISKGANGSDVVLLTIPEIELPRQTPINTNVFGASMTPQMRAVNTMYADMAAPIEISTPVPDDAISTVYQLRITSGWNLRPQGLYILDLPYN